MMIHAYNNYKLYAWGKNELRPNMRQSHFGSILGTHDTGLTIVDSLSTLYIMGMTNEFDEARKWIAKNLNFDNIVRAIENCIKTLFYYLTRIPI